MFGFARLINLTEEDFKPELTRIEAIGMKQYIDEVFREQCDGWSPLELCFWVHNGSEHGDYQALNYQDNETEIEDGVFLSHFTLTKNSIVVAVGYNEDREELYYRVE